MVDFGQHLASNMIPTVQWIGEMVSMALGVLILSFTSILSTLLTQRGGFQQLFLSNLSHIACIRS